MYVLPCIFTICTAQNVFAGWTLLNLPANGYDAFAVMGPYLFAGSYGGGVYRTTDDGVSWMAMDNQLSDKNVISFGVGGGVLYAGTDNGIFRSIDSGATWMLSIEGLTGEIIANGFTSGDTNVFAGLSYSGTYITTDDGLQWKQSINGLSDLDVTALFANSVMSLAGTDTGVFYSSDNGAHWQISDLAGTTIHAFAETGATLFAGTNNGVYISANNGVNWELANSDMTYYTTALAVYGGTIFAGASSGVMLSSDNGANWTSISKGFTDSVDVSSLIVSDSSLFAGTLTGGVWRRPLSELITPVKEETGSSIPATLQLFQNYPNPFNASTTITFSLSEIQNISIKVYNILGEEIAALADGEFTPGAHSVFFDAHNLLNGVYFYRLNTGMNAQTGRMIVLH